MLITRGGIVLDPTGGIRLYTVAGCQIWIQDGVKHGIPDGILGWIPERNTKVPMQSTRHPACGWTTSPAAM